MVFLGLEKIDDTKAKVTLIHYFPNEINEQDKSLGVIVENIPSEEVQDGKIAVPYYYYTTNEMIYEYVDSPKTENQQLIEVQDAIASMSYALMMGGLI